MSDFEIKLNSAGIQELLKSAEVQQQTESYAHAMVAKMNGNYTVDTQTGKYRAVTRVKTADKDTYFRNLHNNEMLKSM